MILMYWVKTIDNQHDVDEFNGMIQSRQNKKVQILNIPEPLLNLYHTTKLIEITENVG